MLWIFHPGYDYGRYLPLPRRIHGFVRDKPSRIRKALLRRGAVSGGFVRPREAPREHVRAVHAESVARMLERADSAEVARAVELPLLARLPDALVRHAIVRPQLLAAGGTALALAEAARGGWAANLSGGFHHARPDLVHGFCLVNDVAVALYALRTRGLDPSVLVVDLDLHQGDGNAAAFADDPRVFTASLHQHSAFPVPKLASDLDLGLPDGADDAAYLAAVDDLLARATAAFTPDVIVYVAGTDPYRDDAIGALRVTADGLLERDRRVARLAVELGAGLVALPAGGYSAESPELSAAGFAAIAALAPASASASRR